MYVYVPSFCVVCVWSATGGYDIYVYVCMHICVIFEAYQMEQITFWLQCRLKAYYVLKIYLQIH